MVKTGLLLATTSTIIIIGAIILKSKMWRLKMSEINEKWSSLEETAEYLGVTKDTIRSWIKKSNIPAHRVGRLWEFKFSEVDD
jgi:DNA binding domain, excisionase family